MGEPVRPQGGDSRRCVATFAALFLAYLAFLAVMRRRIGPEPIGPAGLLTVSRAAGAAAILALAITGAPVRTRGQGRFVFALALLCSTATDWLDGPLARCHGPTLLGSVMDIEADSLLTLAMAAGAVRWGGLHSVALIPPVVRYSDLVRAVLRGAVFTPIGTRSSRATGWVQMLLFLLALYPGRSRRWRRSLRYAGVPVGLAQLATQLRDRWTRAAILRQ